MASIDPQDDPINQPGVFPRSKIPLEVQYRREADQDLRSPAIRYRALGMTMFAGTGWLGSLVVLGLAVVAGVLKRPSTSLAAVALVLLIFNLVVVGLWM